MHRLEIYDKGLRSVVVHFNGDFTGDAIFSKLNPEGTRETMSIPIEAIDNFFATRIRRTLIDRIENLDTAEILKLLTGVQ